MASHSHSHRGSYYATFVALMVLLGVTVGVAHFHLGAWSAPVALAIAALKTVLIGTIFMHLNTESPLVRLFAVAGFLWLALMLSITLSDYETRPADSGSVRYPPETLKTTRE